MVGSNRSIHENAKVVELTKVDDNVYISSKYRYGIICCRFEDSGTS